MKVEEREREGRSELLGVMKALLPIHPLSLSSADFGLAKQKQREFSVMESTVGTMAYWW